MKQTSKLANPAVRRLGFETDLYKILDIRLIPAGQEYDPETGEVTEVARDSEMLEISARNPRSEPVEYEISLKELVRYIAPDLFGDSLEPEAEQEEVEEEEPEPCQTVRRKVSGQEQSYDDWVQDLFRWKARQRAKAK